MPATVRQYRVNTASIASSADGAARKMSDLLQRYKGDLGKALTAYHSGEGNVDKGRIGPIGRKYAPEVMARMSWLAGGKGEISDDPRRNFVDIPISGYEKWHEDFNRRAADAKAKRALEILNGNRAIGEQLKLLSDPTFGEWTLKRQAAARALAEQADAQEDLRRVSERYAETAKSMLDGQKEEADQRLFEISLIGKTREEIERLTLARLWDKQIAAAQKEGVPSDVLANLNQGKADSMGLLKLENALFLPASVPEYSFIFGGLVSICATPPATMPIPAATSDAPPAAYVMAPTTISTAPTTVCIRPPFLPAPRTRGTMCRIPEAGRRNASAIPASVWSSPPKRT